MKFLAKLLVLAAFVGAGESAYAQNISYREAPVDSAMTLRFAAGRVLLEELNRLPEGLKVEHLPNPVAAELDSSSGYRYMWKFRTLVSSLSEGLRLVEFGSLASVGNDWVLANYTGEPFGSEEFASWYSCAGANLRKGVVYEDPSNWTAANCFKQSRTIWYFIAEDSSGRRVKGESELHQLNEVK